MGATAESEEKGQTPNDQRVLPSQAQTDSAVLQSGPENKQTDDFALIFQKPLNQASIESCNFCLFLWFLSRLFSYLNVCANETASESENIVKYLRSDWIIFLWGEKLVLFHL